MMSVKVKKLGLRLKPPALILIYENGDKIRQRNMPIRGLFKNSSVQIIARELKTRHDFYLNDVPVYRLEKQLRIIQETMKGKGLDDSIKIVEKEFSIDPEEDLNKLDDDTLERKKDIMETSFKTNQKKPGDPDFTYDVEVDFGDFCVETSNWDSDDNLEF
ncbi:centrosomal protein of 19 kDa-like [Centruroides vittatus]|uniref:centrosomal protein of 19 kDa-like n=1 Tax=Centruroides sculpturatus TaxID=218467 RepID=UPI000C6D93EF|nr:centrosomal protein of 19 kDa-like [Centruroides sculpturatus]